MARSLEQHGEDLKGLILKANLQAALAHLPRAQVRLKRAEADVFFESVVAISTWAEGRM